MVHTINIDTIGKECILTALSEMYWNNKSTSAGKHYKNTLDAIKEQLKH